MGKFSQKKSDGGKERKSGREEEEGRHKKNENSNRNLALFEVFFLFFLFQQNFFLSFFTFFFLLVFFLFLCAWNPVFIVRIERGGFFAVLFYFNCLEFVVNDQSHCHSLTYFLALSWIHKAKNSQKKKFVLKGTKEFKANFVILLFFLPSSSFSPFHFQYSCSFTVKHQEKE